MKKNYNLRLPRELTRTTINKLMIDVLDKNKQPLYDKVTIDFTTLAFILPAGVVAIDNMIAWLHKKDVEVIFSYYPDRHDNKDVTKYLDDSGFFKKYLRKHLVEDACLRPTTIPLQNVTYEESHGWLRNTFTPWLAGQLNVRIATLGNIEMCLGEIFNNIKDHSSENIGCLYAQHFPQKKLLTFCIADFGVGIPYNVRKLHPEFTDAEALQQAIVEGFTTKTTPRNLGAGLHTMIQNVAVNLRGSVHINSGYGILDVYSGNNGLKLRASEAVGFYPGTFLEFNINTDEVIKEDAFIDEEEFVW